MAEAPLSGKTISDPRAPAERLLGIIESMLRELRPDAAALRVRLDDTIEGDLGLDSLSRMELGLRIERAFDLHLPGEAALSARTPRDLLVAIAAARRAPAPPATLVEAPAPLDAVGAPAAAATLVDAMAWHVERHPEREHLTLVDGDQPVTARSYGALWREAQEVASGLSARGIAPGDKVALMLPTGIAFFQAFLGAMLAGAIPVPLYPPTRRSEFEAHMRGRAAILANADARLLITVREAMLVGAIVRAQLPRLDAVLSVDALGGGRGPVSARAPSAGDTAMLQYTSGSTGDPKGVVLTHANLLANIRTMGAAAGVSSADRFVSWLPLYHDMGLIGAWLGSLYYAVPLTLMPPQSFLARPSRWLRTIHRFRATISAGPNFAYEIAASKVRDADLEGIDLSCWRLAFNGAEPVRAATLERFTARFARYGFDRRAMTPVYGLAESAVGLAFPPLGRGPRIDRIDAVALTREGVARPAGAGCASVQEVVACGLPLPGHAIRIVDDLGRETAPRSEGRIEFRGPSATAGYHHNEAATASLFRGDWLDTGDLGYIADGELFVTSRAKDVIKRGGHNIHPYDLEAAIGDLDGVRKGCVAAFGTPDPATGSERVVVVVETHATDAAVRRALRERIARVAGAYLDGPPEDIALVPPRTVLKTSSGKIRRSACRDLYERRLLEAPRPAVWLQITRLVATSAGAAARRSLRATFRVTYGLYALAVFGLVAVSALALLAVLPAAAARARLARVGARLFLALSGIPVDVDRDDVGEAPQPAIYAVNHASYADAIVLTAVLPAGVRFAAKREFARTRLMAFVLRRLGACYVERADAARGIEDTADVARIAAAGSSIVFFPEGTFTRAPGLAPFRLGAFSVAAATGVGVVPTVLQGTRSVLRDGAWLPERRRIRVAFARAERPAGSDWSAAVELRERVRAAILSRCGEPDLAA